MLHNASSAHNPIQLTAAQLSWILSLKNGRRVISITLLLLFILI